MMNYFTVNNIEINISFCFCGVNLSLKSQTGKPRLFIFVVRMHAYRWILLHAAFVRLATYERRVSVGFASFAFNLLSNYAR